MHLVLFRANGDCHVKSTGKIEGRRILKHSITATISIRYSQIYSIHIVPKRLLISLFVCFKAEIIASRHQSLRLLSCDYFIFVTA